MARVGARIPGSYRTILFLILTLSWTTGLTFFVLNPWVTTEGDFGPEKHPWQSSVLKIHGAAAFIMMIGFGYMLASHIPAGWRTKRLRRVGLSLVISESLLISSGYLLYYAAGDGFREMVSYIHTAIGFGFPFLLATHIYLGLRRRART